MSAAFPTRAARPRAAALALALATAIGGFAFAPTQAVAPHRRPPSTFPSSSSPCPTACA